MNRIVLGALATLLLVSAGIFWWQGRAESQRNALPPTIGAPPPSPASGDEPLPFAATAGRRGPAPPVVSEVTKEQRRFDRLDRNRDSKVTLLEMLGPRVAAFHKLDVNHDNLLTFEEWSVRTSTRFKVADKNGDGWLSREEFVATRPKPHKAPLRCPAPKRVHAGDDEDDGSGGDESDPVQ
ncbi:MAG: hypothetical protein JF593_04635 [Novosphingobium sp.]|nr:hypothetical protein [Novosphingobium sp.]